MTAYTYAFFVGAILYNITGATLGLVTLPTSSPTSRDRAARRR